MFNGFDKDDIKYSFWLATNRHEGVPEHPWQLVAGHSLSGRVVWDNVVETSPANNKLKLNTYQIFFGTLCLSRCLGSQVGPGRADCKDCAPATRFIDLFLI